jgi:hypothetical protein
MSDELKALKRWSVTKGSGFRLKVCGATFWVEGIVLCKSFLAFQMIGGFCPPSSRPSREGEIVGRFEERNHDAGKIIRPEPMACFQNLEH